MYAFPLKLATNGIPLGVKSIGKLQLQFKFGFTSINNIQKLIFFGCTSIPLKITEIFFSAKYQKPETLNLNGMILVSRIFPATCRLYMKYF